MSRSGVAFLALVLATPPAAAQQGFRYPPPELGPDYVEPVTIYGALRELVPPALDVMLLVLALALASWLALRRRTRRGLLALAIGSVVWFGFFRAGCVCPVGSLQNVVQAIADPGAALPAAIVLFFALPLVATLLFGRTFCASVCPLGAVQEVVLVRPLAVPAWLAHGLGILPYAYLALAVLFAATGSAYVICRYDPFVAFFRLSGSLNMLVVGGCFLLIGLFVGRPYCRFLCPYGVLLAWASKLAWKRATVSPDLCVDCRLCEESCPYGAITAPNTDAPVGDPLRGRRTLVAMLLLAPIVVVALAWAGTRLAPVLASAHRRVDLAAQIEREELGVVRETTDASDAFRASGGKIEDLRVEAQAVQQEFAWGSGAAGAFVGLVVALRLIALSVRRRRRDYETDRSQCVACGRCFAWCPVDADQARPAAEGFEV